MAIIIIEIQSRLRFNWRKELKWEIRLSNSSDSDSLGNRVNRALK